MLSIRDITIDQEFEGLIPALSEEERTQLMVNIHRDGFRDPIVVWLDHGLLLDGHNRYRIWEASFQDDENREPSIVGMKFDSRDDAKIWIIKNQFGRRNLAPFTRVELALKLEPLLKAKATANQREHGGTAPGKKTLLSAPADARAGTNTTGTLGVAGAVSLVEFVQDTFNLKPRPVVSKWDLKIKTIDMMQEHGGSFVKALAHAARMADDDNYKKLEAAFPEYWSKYAEMT